MSDATFDGVRYYVSETLPLDRRNDLSEVLDANGATPVSLTDPTLTHFITSSLALEDFVESLPEDSNAFTVTPLWVKRSVIRGEKQDSEYYSPDPAYLFSGVVATATDISRTDCELMSAAIAALGGQWRSAFTRDVTHVFALAPGSKMYETARHFQQETGVRILVPHWFDDTIRLGIRDLPTRNYEWPEPRVFQPHMEGRTSQEDVDYEPPAQRAMLYDTASLSNEEQRKLRPASRNVWKGKRLLLGLSLDLSDTLRKALYADIRRQGGEAVELSSSRSLSDAERARDELAKLDEADIFVTKYRSGAAYAKAYQQKKTIGTLPWLWYVRASGTLTRPADQLLHYPIPNHPADGFNKEVVTVTNYTGKDREYLKKLITLMGGEFTPSMSAEKNTVVVAAFLHGTKTDKATSWSIPIVNHTWVEDCFAQWRRLTPARDKYINFPPGVDFSMVLAERGLGKITWEPGQLEEMQRVADDPEMHESSPRRQRKSKSASASPRKMKKPTRAEEEPPRGTAQSAGEVEEAVAMDEDERMEVDGDEDETRMDVDAGPSKPKGTTPARRSSRAKDAIAEVPSKRKLVRRYTAPRTDDEAPEATTPARDAATTPSPKRPTRTYGSAKSRRMARDEPRGSSPSPVKPRAPRGKQADEDIEMASSSEDEEPQAKSKGKGAEKKTAAKEKEQPKKAKVVDLVSSDSDSDSTEEEIRSVLGDLLPNRKGKGQGKGRASATLPKATRTAQRLDSVLVPSVSSVYGSPEKDKKADEQHPSVSPLKIGPPKKAAKNAAPAQEPTAARPVKSKKPTRPSIPHDPTPPPAAKASRTKTATNAEAGPSRTSTSTSPSKLGLGLGRTPLKRSAATKATQKLHDEIMPDLVSFQREMKRGTVRAAYEEDARSSKSRTPGGAKGKGRKRVSMGSVSPEEEEEEGEEEEEEDEEEEDMPERKKRKTSMDEEAVETGKGKKKAGRKAAAAGSEDPETLATSKGAGGRDVRIMTTQLTLSDDVLRTLTKMGVKMVTKPADCTHLLVRSVVRTEKFLCAMAVAPHVVGEKWAIMSAANRKLLPEATYAIRDEETEKKYAFVLADALQRAKENAGKLFGGVTFYVTPKVPVDAKLLKNVVAANGGQLSIQSPTVRVLAGHDKRFVISCPEDIAIWRPLAQHHKIYTQELILTSALRQAVDWEDTSFQVPGSF